MRVVKYNVSFAFCDEDMTAFGAIPERKMTIDDIQFALRIMSPAASDGWINTIKSLPRNSFTIIEANERLSNGVVITKRIRVRR